MIFMKLEVIDLIHKNILYFDNVESSYLRMKSNKFGIIYHF